MQKHTVSCLLPVVKGGKVHAVYPGRRRRAGDMPGVATATVPVVEPFLCRNQRGEDDVLVVKTEVSLRHEVVAHVLFAVFFAYAYSADVGSPHLLVVIFQSVGKRLQGGYRALVHLADNIVFRLEDT